MAGAVKREAIEGLGLGLDGRLADELGEVGRGRWRGGVECEAAGRHAVGIEGAVLRGCADLRGAWGGGLEVGVHHCAVVLAVAAAAGGQIGLRVGGGGGDEGRGVESAEEHQY